MKLRYLNIGIRLVKSPVPNSMKQIVGIMLILATLGVRAQSFEGTVRWSMSMEITDPQMKAQMEQAQRQLNDPETQAQMKEMEEKMNDPEMKKMMEQNPQVKAAMEQAMKSAKGSGPDMNSMMPKGMTMKVRGANMITLMEGGMADGMEMLFKEGQAPVRINRAKKTYSKMPEGASSGSSPEVDVTRAPQTMTILGYSCQKYLVETKTDGQSLTQIMWTTTDIKDMDMKALSRQRPAQGQPFFTDKIHGVPLRIEVTAPQGNMIMEVKEIKREKLNESDFAIPAGFKETKFSPL